MKRIFCLLLICMMLLVPLTTQAQDRLYPDDIFSSKDAFEQYFEDPDQVNTFETVDGAYVMKVPLEKSNNYVHSKAPIGYESYTIHFEFSLPYSNGYSEANLMFSMTEDCATFHQLSLVAVNGFLYVVHYNFNGTDWLSIDADYMMYDAYYEDSWCKAAVEFTPEEINLYIENEYILTLTETDDYTGDKGYIGLRCGSAEGFLIKNFNVAEGPMEELVATEEPTKAPTEEPTKAPTEEPTAVATQEPTTMATQTPTQEATLEPTENVQQPLKKDSSNIGLWIAVAGVVVIAGVVGVVIYLKKGRK